MNECVIVCALGICSTKWDRYQNTKRWKCGFRHQYGPLDLSSLYYDKAIKWPSVSLCWLHDASKSSRWNQFPIYSPFEIIYDMDAMNSAVGCTVFVLKWLWIMNLKVLLLQHKCYITCKPIPHVVHVNVQYSCDNFQNSEL